MFGVAHGEGVICWGWAGWVGCGMPCVASVGVPYQTLGVGCDRASPLTVGGNESILGVDPLGTKKAPKALRF